MLSEEYANYQEKQEKLRELFFKSSDINDFEKSDFEEETQNEELNQQNIIDNANEYVLLKTLSPEITKNEKKKREHKDTLMKIVKGFLIAQFSFVALVLIGTFVMIFVFHGMKNDLDMEYFDLIIKCISVYITSVVVEFIAMLRYIVKNVFDKSITGLVDSFKDNVSSTVKLLDNDKK